MKVRQVLTVAAVLAASLTVAIALPARPAVAGTSPAGGPAWTIESTPAPSHGGQLNGVHCAGLTACMAVGYSGSAATSAPFAESWNGSKWTATPTPPNPPAKAAQLTAVTCTSPSYCVAAGYYQNSSVVNLTLIDVWNGTTWSTQPTQNPIGSKISQFTSIACTASNACTAAGFFGDSLGSAKTLAEVWNGSKWIGQQTPDPSGAQLTQLQGIACTSSTYCLAVGDYTTATNKEVTLAESWNGKTWSVQPTPAPAGAIASSLTSISCVTAGICHAVGDYANGAGTEFTLSETWNGRSWAVQPTPSPSGAIISVLTYVTCNNSTACAAVGWFARKNGTALTLAEGWNGSSWAYEETPNPAGAPKAFLDSVSCAVFSVCTAVGNDINSSRVNVPLAMQGVVRGTTATTVTSSANPTVAGQGFTLTATVVPKSGAGSISGAVAFKSNGFGLHCNGGGDTVSLTGNHAVCALKSGLGAAVQNIGASYGGNSFFVGSSGAYKQSINRDGSTTSLSSSADPSVTGQSVTFTATVTARAPGSGTPTKTVTFETANGTPLFCNGGGATVNLSGGKAACTVSTGFVAGGHAVVATYAGDSNFAGGTSAAVDQTVDPDTTTVTVSANPGTAVSGESVVFTATALADSPGTDTPTPSGTMTFAINPVGARANITCSNGTNNVVGVTNGSATCMVASRTLFAANSPYTVTAAYSGDANYTSSSGAINGGNGYAVDPDATTTVVTSGANPAVYSQFFDLTATVTADAPGAGTPTGTVSFTVNGSTGNCDDGTDTFPLDSSGQATCPIQTSLQPGTYTVVATYNGDSNYQTSSNVGFNETVNQNATNLAITSSNNPANTGQRVTYTAVVTDSPPGAGQTPKGDVTFTASPAVKGGLNCNGSGTDVVAIAQNANNGRWEADCLAPIPTLGTYTITATYGATTDFLSSTNSLTEVINRPGARPRSGPDGPPAVARGIALARVDHGRFLLGKVAG